MEQVSILLEAGVVGAAIVFDTIDINSNAAWDSTTAMPYSGPIKVSSSKQLRAQSYVEIAGVRTYSQLGKYQYILDRPPTVSLTSPHRRRHPPPLDGVFPDRPGHRSGHRGRLRHLPIPGRHLLQLGGHRHRERGALYGELDPGVSSSHLLRAVAVDPDSARTVSTAVAVTVTEPNMPPTDVVLTAPADGYSPRQRRGHPDVGHRARPG